MKNVYDTAFDKGHDMGYQKGYQDGYKDGFIWGQRAIIPQSFVHGFNYAWSLSDAEKIKITQQSKILKSLTENNEAVAQDMEKAINEQRGLSIVRVGDAEMMVMAQGMLPDQTIKLRGHMLWKNLQVIPDLKAKALIVKTTWQADWVGLPLGRGYPECDALFAQLMFNNPPLQARITSSVVNYRLAKQGFLSQIMYDRRILVVGNTAQKLSDYLKAQGYNCVGAIQPVQYISDAERVFNLVKQYEFDLALVAAGVAAIPICVHIAQQLNKVALDFGHMSDELISGRSSLA